MTPSILKNFDKSKTMKNNEVKKLTPYQIIFNCFRRTDKSNEKLLYNYYKEFVDTITSIEYIINELVEFKKIKNNLVEKKMIDNKIFIKNHQENIYDLIMPTSILINK
jgi:hypothetical protein